MTVKILCVEDNPQNMRLVRKYLRGTDYTFLEAENGLSGVEMAQTEQPDLILMDINLPDISGIEATKRIKADASLQHIPIIALTANIIHGNEDNYIEAGFDSYIGKPISRPVLLDQIAAHLAKRSTSE